MAPLFVLLAVTAVARALGWWPRVGWLESWPHAVAVGLAAMFVLTASAHFVQPRRRALVAMVPPRLPRPEMLVTVTGALELVGAVGVLVPATSRAAAICLAVLLVIMFPANVRAARAELGIKSMPLPLRTLVQLVFIGACVVVAAG